MLSGRVALVTGASGGIGQALVAALGGADASVAAHYSSNADGANAAVAGIERGIVVHGDMADPEVPQQVVDEVVAQLGPIDVLVANHGLGGVASWEDVDAALFDRMLAVNLRAPFLLARAVLPGMRERGFGRVLFMSSIAGLTGGIVGPHYAASKAGLHGMLHHLAARVAADGVTVNALAPALIEETGMLPGDPRDLAARIPVGRLGRPAEVADLALAVLSNGYVTNEIIAIDGGLHPH